MTITINELAAKKLEEFASKGGFANVGSFLEANLDKLEPTTNGKLVWPEITEEEMRLANERLRACIQPGPFRGGLDNEGLDRDLGLFYGRTGDEE